MRQMNHTFDQPELVHDAGVSGTTVRTSMSSDFKAIGRVLVMFGKFTDLDQGNISEAIESTRRDFIISSSIIGCVITSIDQH